MTSHSDAFAHLLNGESARVRLLAVGDNVVDMYPQQGVLYPGGNAVNVAVHAARLGGDAAYIGALGNDHAGQVVLDALRRERVDTSRTRIVDGPNATAVVNVVDGNRVFASGDFGVSVFELTQDDLNAAAQYDVVHTGECSNMESQLTRLQRSSRRLSFDFSERPWEYVQHYAPLASIAIWSAPTGDLPNAHRQAERLRALGPDLAVVTLGPQGALVLREHMTYRPAPVGDVVDTLGAGDALIARLLVGLVREEAIGTLLADATAYATASCATFGAFGYAAPLLRSTTAL